MIFSLLLNFSGFKYNEHVQLFYPRLSSSIHFQGIYFIKSLLPIAEV